MRPFPVTSSDAAWLRMEEPSNPMTITGVVGLGARLEREDLGRFLSERLARFDRFAMRIEGVGTRTPTWVPDPDFDMDRHLFEADLPEPGGKAGLEALVSDLMSRPLSFAHSPWTFHLVHDVDDGEGHVGSALVVRLHHVIGDGVALMHVFINAVDEYFDAGSPTRRERTPTRPLGQRIASTLKGAGGEAVELLTRPRHLGRRLKAAGGGVAALGGLLATRPDSTTSLKGTASPDKRAAWTRSFSLRAVKDVSDRLDGKVNDVLMAVAGGALRRYFQATGQSTDVTVRVAAPVNVRPLERAYELGNSFALFFVELPVSQPTVRQRLEAMKATMDDAKASKEPAVVYAILQSIGKAPRWAHRMVVELFAQKASGVLTNVPGPKEPLHIMGAPVTTMMFWVPQAGDIGLGIAILSLDGTVRVGVCTDAAYVDDPSALAQAFEAEFEAVAGELGVPITRALGPDERGAEAG